jgi:hypothetical protein
MSTLSQLIQPGNVATAANAITLANKTINNPIVTDYIETAFSAGTQTALTVNLSNGTVQRVTVGGSGITITLPASVAGKSFIVIVTYTGVQTVAWLGGSVLKWAGGTAPTVTSINGKTDIFSFFQDGTNTYGAAFGVNF